jgi:hypothetical protein
MKNFIKHHSAGVVLSILNMPWVILFLKQFYEVYIVGGF